MFLYNTSYDLLDITVNLLRFNRIIHIDSFVEELSAKSRLKSPKSSEGIIHKLIIFDNK